MRAFSCAPSSKCGATPHGRCGLPIPSRDCRPRTRRTYPADLGDRHHLWSEEFSVSREEVEANFRRYGLLDEQVRFLEGWLQGHPAERADPESGCVAARWRHVRIRQMQALAALYDRLSVGGFVIVDDYYLEACAKAIHDFRSQRGITDPMQDIDGKGAFWRRSAQTAPFSGEAQTGRESSPQETLPISDLRFLMARATLDIRPRVLQTPETVRDQFDLDYSSSSRTETLFYEFACELAPTPPDNFDGILCATVLHAMAEGRDVHLHGSATSTMLLESGRVPAGMVSLAANRVSARCN